MNLVQNVLEIYRTPVVDDSAAFGWRYASRTVLRAEDSATPLALPSAHIAVRDLLP